MRKAAFLKKVLVVLVIFLSTQQLFPQDKVKRVDVTEIILNAIDYEKEGEYEKAYEEMCKIPEKDSTYSSSLTSRAYYLNRMEDMEDEAIKVTEAGLKLKYHANKYYFLINNAGAYLRLEKYKTAIEKYDEILEKYPKNFLVYYNKGLAYEGIKKFEKASEMYQKAITLNPYHANSHLKLGILCHNEHHISQATMCINMYLLLDPDGSNSFNVLNAFNNMLKTKNEKVKHDGVEISEDDESFEETDLLINNYVALNKKYKTPSKIKLAIIKQTHLLLQKLDDYEGYGGFWEKYYVPFYKFILKDNHFNQFAYTIAYSVENPKYKALINKNISGIKSFIKIYRDKWEEIIGKQEAIIDGKKKNVTYLYSDKNFGIGVLNNDKCIGKWEVFNNYGGLSSVGIFDDDGEKHGKWIYYDKYGNISEENIYVHGKINDECFTYHENGKIEISCNYKDGKLHGNYERYRKNGSLKLKCTYVDGEIDGDYISYHDLGEGYIKYKIPYKKDKIEGIVYEYFSDGKEKSEMTFKDDKKEGTETIYYNDGQIDTKKEFEDGKLEGEFVEYHFNGTIYRKGICKEGYYEGYWVSHYSNKSKQNETHYSKGKIDGVMKKHDRDGKLYCEFNYRKGEVISYKFFNKKQEIIKEAKKQKGEFYYEGHNAIGNIISEGLYDISGGNKGEWKYYDDNHVLSSKESYTDGSLTGISTTYHLNGEVKSLTPYENDTIHGYYSSFFSNKQLKKQGWYHKGKPTGEWIFYYVDGTVQNKKYFTNGKLYGESENFTVNGKLQSEYLYLDDDLKTEYFYNPDGEVFDVIDLDVDSSLHIVTTKYMNGKTDQVYTFRYDTKHGDYKGYFFGGKKRATGNYFDGEKHGEWIWYYESGKIETKGTFFHGNKIGTWINYHENGKIENEDNYDSGYEHGFWKTFSEKGVLLQEQEYVIGERNGAMNLYSEDGKLQLIRYYDNGRLIGYSYLDKNSKKLPMIPIVNETVKIVSYFNNGKVGREIDFVNGKFQGSYKEYYYTGQICEDLNYVDSERHGECKTYHSNGKLRDEMNYNRGNLHGTIKEYYTNGKLKKEATYLNNDYHGTYKKYDSSGKLIKEKEYFDGEVISEKIIK